MSVAETPGVVEQMLDHAANGRWDALREVLDPEFEIVEPESLPYGGVHRGVSGYVSLMKEIGELFDLDFQRVGLDALGEELVILRMFVTFTARSGRRSVRLPVVELLQVRGSRVRRSEVYISDTAALLEALA